MLVYNQKWKRSHSRSRDLDVQGHASRLQCWLMLHWVSWPEKPWKQKKIIAVACLQPEIGKVPFKVTWPWRTRSRDIQWAHNDNILHFTFRPSMWQLMSAKSNKLLKNAEWTKTWLKKSSNNNHCNISVIKNVKHHDSWNTKFELDQTYPTI